MQLPQYLARSQVDDIHDWYWPSSPRHPLNEWAKLSIFNLVGLNPLAQDMLTVYTQKLTQILKKEPKQVKMEVGRFITDNAEFIRSGHISNVHEHFMFHVRAKGDNPADIHPFLDNFNRDWLVLQERIAFEGLLENILDLGIDPATVEIFIKMWLLASEKVLTYEKFGCGDDMLLAKIKQFESLLLGIPSISLQTILMLVQIPFLENSNEYFRLKYYLTTQKE